MNRQLDDLLLELSKRDLQLVSERAGCNDARITKIAKLENNYEDLKHVYNSIFDERINSFYYDKNNSAYSKIMISMNKAMLGVFDYQLKKSYTIHDIVSSKILESDDDER